MGTATQMVQAWLDCRTRNYETGNFDAYADGIVLPMVIVTRSAVMVVEDEDKLRLGFDAWCSMLRNQRVSDSIYTILDVTELDTDLITAQYVTHLLRDATPICEPFKTQTTFQRSDDNAIRAVSMTTGLRNLSWPITVPRVAGGGETLDWTPDDPAPRPRGEETT